MCIYPDKLSITVYKSLFNTYQKMAKEKGRNIYSLPSLVVSDKYTHPNTVIVKNTTGMSNLMMTYLFFDIVALSFSTFFPI